MITHSVRVSFLIIQNHKRSFIQAINLPTASKSHSNVKLLWLMSHVLYDMYSRCTEHPGGQSINIVCLFVCSSRRAGQPHQPTIILCVNIEIDRWISLFVNLLISFALPNPCKGMNGTVCAGQCLWYDFESNPFFLRQRFESMPIKGDYTMSP